MVFYIIVVTSLMTFLGNRSSSIENGWLNVGWNPCQLLIDVWCVIHLNIYVIRYCHGWSQLWIPCPNSQVTWEQYVKSQRSRAWKLGLTTSHEVPSHRSQVWHECLHGNTFWRWGLERLLEDFQGPLDCRDHCHGHDSWFVFKATMIT